jgi:hypothetical protein
MYFAAVFINIQSQAEDLVDASVYSRTSKMYTQNTHKSECATLNISLT